MKRLICILLCITFLFSMSACDVRLNTTGDVKNVKVEKWEASKIYSDDEIGDVANSLNYMASQLRDSNEYQQKFISNISHDFRSPLTSIKSPSPKV